jgi:hypothetical protein
MVGFAMASVAIITVARGLHICDYQCHSSCAMFRLTDSYIVELFMKQETPVYPVEKFPHDNWFGRV